MRARLRSSRSAHQHVERDAASRRRATGRSLTDRPVTQTDRSTNPTLCSCRSEFPAPTRFLRVERALQEGLFAPFQVGEAIVLAVIAAVLGVATFAPCSCAERATRLVTTPTSFWTRSRSPPARKAASPQKSRKQHGDTRLATVPDRPARRVSQSDEVNTRFSARTGLVTRPALFSLSITHARELHAREGPFALRPDE